MNVLRAHCFSSRKHELLACSCSYIFVYFHTYVHIHIRVQGYIGLLIDWIIRPVTEVELLIVN